MSERPSHYKPFNKDNNPEGVRVTGVRDTRPTEGRTDREKEGVGGVGFRFRRMLITTPIFPTNPNKSLAIPF